MLSLSGRHGVACLYATNYQKTLVVLVDASRKRRGCAAATIPVVSLIWLGEPAGTEYSETGSRVVIFVWYSTIDYLS